jgi:hypothetical protein
MTDARAALHAQLEPAGFLRGKVVLLAQLLGLLVIFIGPGLTTRLVGQISRRGRTDHAERQTGRRANRAHLADDGVGVTDWESANTPNKHGRDYVAIFVRQLGGTFVVSGSEVAGTSVRIRFPVLVALPQELLDA